MRIKAVFPDGTWLAGRHTLFDAVTECFLCRNFMVTAGTDHSLLGKRISVPYMAVKYFVLNDKEK